MSNSVFVDTEKRFAARVAARKTKLDQLRRLNDRKPFDWRKVEEAERLAERASRLGMSEEAGALAGDPDDTETGQRDHRREQSAGRQLPP